jgi:hypothetical protein
MGLTTEPSAWEGAGGDRGIGAGEAVLGDSNGGALCRGKGGGGIVFLYAMKSIPKSRLRRKRGGGKRGLGWMVRNEVIRNRIDSPLIRR